MTGLLAMAAVRVAAGAGQATAPAALTIAAASDLQAALPELVKRFESEAGVRVRTSFGSSGNFFAQIQNGAPFDVFMSADVDYPRRLVAAGDADAGTLYLYATGRLALWTRRATSIDVARGLSVLTDGRVRRIAIANPEHAPYGRAAVAAMQQAGVYDAVRGKLVLGENISQAAQFADSGNADVGIIALALALGPTLQAAGAYAQIPETAHPPIEQAAVAIARSRAKVAADRFIAFLKTPPASELLARFGFAPPRHPATR